MNIEIEWNTIVNLLKDIGLVFSIFASGYSLFSIFKNRPKVDIDILDITIENGFLAIKLSFQNSGEQMSSATRYILELGEESLVGFQKLEQEIFPTGNHSISKPKPRYVEAYPLELPQGKACHFTIFFKIDSVEQKRARLRISLINQIAKKIDFTIPENQSAKFGGH